VFGGSAYDTLYTSCYYTPGSDGDSGSLLSFKYGKGVIGSPGYTFGG